MNRELKDFGGMTTSAKLGAGAAVASARDRGSGGCGLGWG